MGRSLVVEADGGSRGNPGVAGYGALVRDAGTGALLAERAEPLGKQSNNVAEYRGLIAGLRAAVRIDPAADVAVRMDSKLVIEQMAGRWKIKHPDMRVLAGEAQEIIRGLIDAGGSVTWTWIPRAENKDADRLSNDGMDGRTVEHDLWQDALPSDGAAGPVAGSATAREPEVASADIGAPARVLLVRHGVTDFTVQSRLDGRGGADPSLNPEGKAQAEQVAEALAKRVTGRAVVVTSSLARAGQTGAAIAAALGLNTQVDEGWDEQSFGAWDGLTFKQIHSDSPDGLARLRSDETYAVDGGESHRDLAVRVEQAFRRAVDLAGPGGTVVVVTHRKPIMVVLSGLLGISMDRSWMLEADPASVSGIKMWQDQHASISFLNDTTHLRSHV
ncbi:bifunctional RNase H/acid phosphatase [Leekyejoonella antrihumi]|uniref:Bifunctional RNase H/acid phosphatase n=1 Tax=Leekyejoonella antrihumi TaxID=1660198 RepID=A0A563E369_9MICO|nr:bifunctional RNase H/acid phosphatase [Leekyejoonella antrihumi]TWP36334.1 bifunctional RNase H/acid phosphatase [Leekyejoonella antrihumi]